MMDRRIAVVCGLGWVASAAFAQYTKPQADDNWVRDEGPLLSGHVELTKRDQFVKAGEAYFDPTSTWIIFQAVPVPPEGEEPDANYSMYVAKLARNEAGDITGLEEPICLSEPGSANTCGWFHPTIPGLVLFGSTMVAPSDHTKPGYDSGRYRWSFPVEMDVVTRYVPQIAEDVAGIKEVPAEYADQVDKAKPLFERPGYTAEGSWSPDGRYVLYTHADPEQSEARRPDGDIWIYDTRTGTHTPIVKEIGYDGGPFFSADGKSIVYRSDRHYDSLLQVFIKDLVFDDSGAVSPGTEYAMTDNTDVNWAPYWHPSQKLLIYATSEMGHTNYEIFAVQVDRSKDVHDLASRRVTRAAGADVLPVFNPDGSMMMWTCQRGEVYPGEEKPSSQVWLAKVDTSISVDDWFGTIDDEQALNIALREVREREGWEREGLEFDARRAEGDVWRIRIWHLPKEPGAFRVVELARDGTLLRYVNPS